MIASAAALPVPEMASVPTSTSSSTFAPMVVVTLACSVSAPPPASSEYSKPSTTNLSTVFFPPSPSGA